VVEDEASIALLIESMLEDFGCEVVASVGKLSAAQELAASLAFDVALLDVNIRGERIFPVCDLLLKRAIPFVLSTGYGAAILPDHLSGGPILTKPFGSQDLFRAISQAVPSD